MRTAWIAMFAAAVPFTAHAQVVVAGSATCPGSLDATLSGLTSLGGFAVLSADGAGSAALPPGPCSGTMTGLSAAGLALRHTGVADPGGVAVLSTGLPAAACGMSYQVLDLTTCALSPVGAIPESCAAPYTDALGPASDFTEPDGELVLFNSGYFPYFSGAIYDAPPLEYHVETARVGACRLVEHTPSVCMPSCTVGVEACIDGSCVPYPGRVGAGDLTLASGGASAVVSPDVGMSYVQVLPAEATEEVSVSTTGGVVSPFATTSCPVVAPAAVGDWSMLLDSRLPGADVTLTWSDADPEARVRLHMTTGVATHGGIAHAEIECEGPDTGTLTLPGPFLDVLYSQGWSCGECGGNELQRYRAGGATPDGRDVRFTIQDSAYFWYIPRP